ncbi:thioesterase [Pseudoclavibacter endophyticus]|uniref:Acyl-CoA thioesterase n=1 Tax=Pseudoclavibacter endophyticus TaxID=1778590 RepID=A0A6H9WGJ5_9MICO|nr:thioesterase family protein [Pseudoclavibacter endophyticus]KAB1646721.1 acyl-CoA thioesterase [Pseudoclavibacter endophyticus]GGA76119.1 thioesterase [Pseudoclavibacter endophyticus]
MRYHVPIRLRWSDLDAYNHVNNSRVLSLLEEARVRTFWTSDDGEASPLAVIEGHQGASTQTLIARHEIEYLAAIPYQAQPIDIHLWVGRLGAASCEVGYEVWSPPLEAGPDHTEGRTKYVVAASTIVFIDTASQRPRRISDAERHAWAPYVEEPAKFRGTR